MTRADILPQFRKGFATIFTTIPTLSGYNWWGAFVKPTFRNSKDAGGPQAAAWPLERSVSICEK
jgi:hypothetical protein